MKKDDNWLFIGTDPRLATCSAIFTQRGYISRHVSTNEMNEELRKSLVTYSPKQIVFPILQMKETLPLELLQQGTRLFTGVTTKEWLLPFINEGHTSNSYVQEEHFIWENAKLTAEAFVHEYYARTKRCISNSSFCVAGFGKVGKMTAHVLTSLGGNVTILARSNSQLGEATVLGYKTIPLTTSFEMKDVNLVNTIPHKWLSISPNPEIHIYDLASAPGCLKEDLTSEYYTVLLGLPGKHFPLDAATVLADALERMYKG